MLGRLGSKKPAATKTLSTARCRITAKRIMDRGSTYWRSWSLGLVTQPRWAQMAQQLCISRPRANPIYYSRTEFPTVKSLARSSDWGIFVVCKVDSLVRIHFDSSPPRRLDRETPWPTSPLLSPLSNEGPGYSAASVSVPAHLLSNLASTVRQYPLTFCPA
jgi:hypothetical protein